MELQKKRVFLGKFLEKFCDKENDKSLTLWYPQPVSFENEKYHIYISMLSFILFCCQVGRMLL